MVKEDKIYISKAAENLFEQIDFADTFSTTNHEDDLETIAHKVFKFTPGWIMKLMNLRNSIVAIFGLKTEAQKDARQAYEVGAYMSFFKILSIEENELIMGANDSHLNFRAVVSNTGEEAYNIKVTTLVEYNNRFGRLYMTVIKLGHKMILKSLLKRAYRDPENSQKVFLLKKKH